MRTFDESSLRFTFSADWWVEQYDVLTDYQNLNNAVKNSKAVDFVGIINNETLSFIEVKNFRGHRIANKPRLFLGDDPIEDEVAQKVRDTLEGITAAARNSTNLKLEWQRVLSFIQNESKNVEIILWFEEETHSSVSSAKRMNAKGGTVARRLKQKLNWLTNRVFVCHISDNVYSRCLDVAFL